MLPDSRDQVEIHKPQSRVYKRPNTHILALESPLRPIARKFLIINNTRLSGVTSTANWYFQSVKSSINSAQEHLHTHTFQQTHRLPNLLLEPIPSP